MEDTGVMASIVQEGWLVWEVPGKPVSVRVSLDVVSRLGMAVQEGFKALPRRGLEIGGLLIGTVREAGNLIVVDVDDFEPIESEHATGPSYVLSDGDRTLLKERISAREATAKLPPIVGFYRSHSRKDFAITAEDAHLFSSYCPKASDVFLLIKSNGAGPPVGGFIIREGGKVISDSPYVQFALDWTLGIRAAREAPARAVEVSPAPPPVSHPVQSPPAPRAATWLPQNAPAVRWPSWLVTAGVLGLAVGLSFAILRRPPVPSPANARPPLALSVTAAGNGLRLSWDHQASQPAGHGVLWIKDGPDEQSFELDSKQLSEGSVAYWPKNSDVTFRLALVSAAGASVTESVRSIGGPSKPLQTVPAPQAVAVAASHAPAVKASRAVARAPKRQRGNPVGSASRQLSRAFVMPQPETVSTAATPARLPDPPMIASGITPGQEHNKEFLKPVVPAAGLQSSDSPVRVRVEPLSGSRLERLGRSLPLIGKRYRRPDYVPPAALRNPGLTSPLQRSVPRDVNIDVKVYVDPAGKVEYSEVLSKVAGPDRDLAASALFSARRWEFVPARDGDGTVPGEVILHYQFGPGARLAQ